MRALSETLPLPIADALSALAAADSLHERRAPPADRRPAGARLPWTLVDGRLVPKSAR